jgi:hypothetical protein
MSLWTGSAPVGLGRAACTQPLEAQEPQATIALACSAVSLQDIQESVAANGAVDAAIGLVGALPSTARR